MQIKTLQQGYLIWYHDFDSFVHYLMSALMTRK